MTELMNTAELAHALKLSPWTVRDLARAGKLPTVHGLTRGKYLFDPVAVEAAIRGVVPPAPEPEPAA